MDSKSFSRELTTTSIVSWLLVVLVGYSVGLIAYRLYLHPLANVPGPRLAAATGFYEFYYDIVLRGKYIFRIKELHAQYGPIIRICPNEVHIDDPTYWPSLFNQSTRRMQKPAKSAYMVGPIPSGFSSVEPELHRLRRAPLSPLFSRNGVAKILPDIQGILDDLSSRLRDAHKSGEKVNLVYAFTAVTIDIINEFCFASTYKATLMPDFNKAYYDGSVTYMYTALLGMQIPGIHENFISRIPPRLMAWANAAYARILGEHAKWAKQIDDIRTGKDSNYELTSHDTIFHVLSQSNLPAHEKTTERMQGEAVVMLNAGTMTTAGFLKLITYFLLEDPVSLRRLKDELKAAIPNPRVIPSLATLENLDYLSAVVKEGLRMSYGSSHRLRRIAPDDDMSYGKYVLPKGYTVSMSPVLMHENPDIFPDPTTFKPERWLKPNRTAEMERALVPFSAGSRTCLGINLANAELHLGTATIFRRFDLKMHNVDRARDIDMNHDFFTPQVAMDSPGLEVTVTGCDW